MKLWKFLLLLGAAALVSGVLLVAVNFMVLPSLVHHNQVVTMPDLRGRDFKAAQDEVRPLGLRLEVARSRAHPSLPAGSIVDQVPLPEARIRGGRVVKVIVSSGHPSGLLPSVVGLTPKQAEVTLQRNRYRPGLSLHLPRPGVTQPVVAYQSPQAGVDLPTGRTVDLVVAEPAPRVRLLLPDLTGMPLYQAKQLIGEAGLVLGQVQYSRSGAVGPNHILAQEPAAGTRVGRGDRLVLVVATR